MSELRQENRCPVSAQTVAGSRSVFGPASTWFIAALQIKVNMRLLLETLTIILVVGATTLNVGAANEHSIARDPALFDERVYIVQLEQPPALSYRGKPGGLAGTRPLKGQRFNPRSSNVRQYSRHLTDTHDDLLQSVGAHDGKLYRAVADPGAKTEIEKKRIECLGGPGSLFVYQ
jgi:hypothetical protein